MFRSGLVFLACVAMLMCIMGSAYALNCPDIPTVKFYNCHYWGGTNEKWCYIHAQGSGPNFWFVGYLDPNPEPGVTITWVTNDPNYNLYVPGDSHKRGLVVRKDEGSNLPVKFILRQQCWEGTVSSLRDIVYTSPSAFAFCLSGRCDAGWDHPDHTIN